MEAVGRARLADDDLAVEPEDLLAAVALPRGVVDRDPQRPRREQDDAQHGIGVVHVVDVRVLVVQDAAGEQPARDRLPARLVELGRREARPAGERREQRELLVGEDQLLLCGGQRRTRSSANSSACSAAHAAPACSGSRMATTPGSASGGPAPAPAPGTGSSPNHGRGRYVRGSGALVHGDSSAGSANAERPQQAVREDAVAGAGLGEERLALGGRGAAVQLRPTAACSSAASSARPRGRREGLDATGRGARLAPDLIELLGALAHRRRLHDDLRHRSVTRIRSRRRSMSACSSRWRRS